MALGLALGPGFGTAKPGELDCKPRRILYLWRVSRKSLNAARPVDW